MRRPELIVGLLALGVATAALLVLFGERILFSGLEVVAHRERPVDTSNVQVQVGETVGRSESTREVRGFSILINENDYLLFTDWKDGAFLRHTTLDELTGLAQELRGDAESIRVTICRRGVTQDATEELLFESLLAVGLPEASIVWAGQSDAWSHLDDKDIPPQPKP